MAGVQLKFTGNSDGDRLTAPAREETGRCIIKLGSKRFSDLPETEFTAMQMASAIGIRTASCRLKSRGAIRDVPAELLQSGLRAL
ncbi:HipA domain-containing protein [Bradyrhizobium lupini]|uniref:HipA domain-containing protein n=1 Tax=Rhizobium lupini TaxID=136996 RepID=UPI00296F923E